MDPNLYYVFKLPQATQIVFPIYPRGAGKWTRIGATNAFTCYLLLILAEKFIQRFGAQLHFQGRRI